jgi:hypothetical protein
LIATLDCRCAIISGDPLDGTAKRADVRNALVDNFLMLRQRAYRVLLQSAKAA